MRNSFFSMIISEIIKIREREKKNEKLLSRRRNQKYWKGLLAQRKTFSLHIIVLGNTRAWLDGINWHEASVVNFRKEKKRIFHMKTQIYAAKRLYEGTNIERSTIHTFGFIIAENLKRGGDGC